jgi:hypothetical protein
MDTMVVLLFVVVVFVFVGIWMKAEKRIAAKFGVAIRIDGTVWIAKDQLLRYSWVVSVINSTML